jgi:bifunctional non-homologous end joining protein LigD
MSSRRGLSSPDKVLWPQPGFTKRDLWVYMTAVAPRLLPQLADRPLTLKRYPNGVEGPSFFQKNLPDSAPDHLERFCQWSESSKREVCYLVVRTVEDLQWTANMGTLELHPWTSRTDRPDRADQLMFDLDPGSPSQSVVQAAHQLKAILDELELESMVKTSGKRGLHVVVPIERRYEASLLRGFGLGVARATAACHPEELTVEMRKAKRGDRLLLDWSRNGAAQTVVAAWSPRAHPAGTVSMPLGWDEVTEDLDPTRFTIATATERGDAWADPPGPQRIEQARAALLEQGYDCADASPRSTRDFT